MNTKLKHIKHSGFKAPEDYFNTLEDSVFNKINSQSQLENINNSGFNVPENYFDTIEDNILNSLNVEEKQIKVISIFNKRNLLYASSIAAALVLMFNIFNQEKEITFDTIDLELVDNYMSNHNINSEDLATLWNETELNNIDFEELEFLDETVQDYILNNSDIEDLIID